MSSTFFGLNIGASALNAYSASINTTANNVSNANTEGYCRQVTNLVAAGSMRNYNYGTLGSGVVAESITQMRNNYYDFKFWANNSDEGQYEKRIYYVEQVQNLFIDFADTKGFASIYGLMFNSLESLKGDSPEETIRAQFIHDTESLMEYFNHVSARLKDIQNDCNQEVKALVSQINTYARKISVLNDKINTIEIQGSGSSHANELRDQRALLIDELSKIVNVEVDEIDIQNSNYPDMYTGATNFSVRVAGQTLVDGGNYSELEVYSRERRVNQNDIDGLYGIRWADTKNDFNAAAATMSGELKAVLDTRDGNNLDNFKGKVEKVQGHTLTVSDPSIKTVEAMNMPERGLITIGTREFTYSSFAMKVATDANGNETYTYEFQIEGNDVSSLAGSAGKPVRIGTSIDAKGIPYYLSQMNEFLRSFCHKLNNVQMYGTIEKNEASDRYGVTQTGDPMGAFIISNRPSGDENTFDDAEGIINQTLGTVIYKSTDDNYYYLTAENVSVNAKSLKDPNYLATSSRTPLDESKAEIVNEMLKLQNDTVIYRGSGGTQFLEYITTDVSVDVNEAEILHENFKSIGETIDNYRMSVSSVDEDDEGMDLVRFQNAYNLASKIISVMNQMYDRLITQTGV